MNPQKLFIEESIEINASTDKIWDALTRTESTRAWANNFVGAGGEIVSDWKLGRSVLWKDNEGSVIVEGNVTAAEPYKLLRFTVFDVLSQRPAVTDEDGITYQLTAMSDKTHLQVRQGDFSAMPDGTKYREMSTDIWKRVLPAVKAVAEGTK